MFQVIIRSRKYGPKLAKPGDGSFEMTVMLAALAEGTELPTSFLVKRIRNPLPAEIPHGVKFNLIS